MQEMLQLVLITFVTLKQSLNEDCSALDLPRSIRSCVHFSSFLIFQQVSLFPFFYVRLDYIRQHYLRIANSHPEMRARIDTELVEFYRQKHSRHHAVIIGMEPTYRALRDCQTRASVSIHARIVAVSSPAPPLMSFLERSLLFLVIFLKNLKGTFINNAAKYSHFFSLSFSLYFLIFKIFYRHSFIHFIDFDTFSVHIKKYTLFNIFLKYVQ